MATKQKSKPTQKPTSEPELSFANDWVRCHKEFEQLILKRLGEGVQDDQLLSPAEKEGVFRTLNWDKTDLRKDTARIKSVRLAKLAAGTPEEREKLDAAHAEAQAEYEAAVEANRELRNRIDKQERDLAFAANKLSRRCDEARSAAQQLRGLVPSYVSAEYREKLNHRNRTVRKQLADVRGEITRLRRLSTPPDGESVNMQQLWCETVRRHDPSWLAPGANNRGWFPTAQYHEGCKQLQSEIAELEQQATELEKQVEEATKPIEALLNYYEGGR
jgi:DNA repair exonuclease SbcCD ATPase subunit